MPLYVLTGLHFRPIKGRCVHENHIRKLRDNLIDNCEDWEEAANVVETHKKQVEEIIFEINNRLYNILEVLNIDREN